MIPERGAGKSSTQLHQHLLDAGYRCSKRTVERDLNDLSAIFPLDANTKSIPHGWRWMPGANVELPGLHLSDALSLHLLEESIRPLIPSAMLKSLEIRFSQARQKLEVLADDNPSARWIDKVASVRPQMSLMPPRVDVRDQEVVQQALLDGVQIGCNYHSAHRGEDREFVLNPLGLVQRGQVTYLIATVGDYADVRQFALHRFSNSQRLNTPNKGPGDFNLKSYIVSGAMQFAVTGKITLLAQVNATVATILRETPLSEDMQLSSGEDGWMQLQATVNDSWELKWWLLSHAGAIRIDAPQSLRTEITERLQQALTLHA
jgi:predicted DNA-binding transcriptional regulator YafY